MSFNADENTQLINNNNNNNNNYQSIGQKFNNHNDNDQKDLTEFAATVCDYKALQNNIPYGIEIVSGMRTENDFGVYARWDVDDCYQKDWLCLLKYLCCCSCDSPAKHVVEKVGVKIRAAHVNYDKGKSLKQMVDEGLIDDDKLNDFKSHQQNYQLIAHKVDSFLPNTMNNSHLGGVANFFMIEKHRPNLCNDDKGNVLAKVDKLPNEFRPV